MAYLNVPAIAITPEKSTRGPENSRCSTFTTSTKSSPERPDPRRRLDFLAVTSANRQSSSRQHSHNSNFDHLMQDSPPANSAARPENRPRHSVTLILPPANMAASERRSMTPERHQSFQNTIDSDSTISEGQHIVGLMEARLGYGDTEPDFVIGKPRDGMKRSVHGKLREGTFVDTELVFNYWDQDQTRGFWTYTDDDDDIFIVKFFSAGSEYRPWLSLEDGYHDEALAVSRKAGRNVIASKKTGRNVIASKKAGGINDTANLNKPHIAPGSAVSDKSSEDEAPRNLRKRKIDQVRPYTTEKANYQRIKDGKQKKNFKREYDPATWSSIEEPDGSNRHGSGKLMASTSRSRVSSGSANKKATPTPEPVSVESIQNTTLYVFTNSDFDAPPGTVYLKSCKDVDSFFSIMPLVAGVNEEEIGQITVRFGWMPESSQNTIKMIRGLQDSYDKMVEEIRGAPAWRKGGEGRVGVFVNVVLK